MATIVKIIAIVISPIITRERERENEKEQSNLEEFIFA